TCRSRSLHPNPRAPSYATGHKSVHSAAKFSRGRGPMSFLRQFFAVQTVSTAPAGGERLKRALGPLALTAIGLGATIGTGIFALTGTVAAEHSGPALTLSLLIALIPCTFAALCYSEFASFLPVSGSAYSYAYATIGEGLAWFIGWNLTLEYLLSASAV